MARRGGGGRLRSARRSIEPTATSISRPPRRRPRRRRNGSPAATTSCSSRSRPTRLGPALRWEPSRGGALFPHLYGALPLAAVVWARPLPLGADGRHDFGESGVLIRAMGALATPLLLAPAARSGASRDDRGAGIRAVLAEGRRADPSLAVSAFGLDVSPIRSAWRRASTRTPKSPRALLGARLRLRRGRHADAAAAGAAIRDRGCSGCAATAR